MKHEKFAHLIESEEHGQLVVMNDTNSEGEPGLKVFFTAPGTGVNEAHLGVDQDELDEKFGTLTDDDFKRIAEGLVAGAKASMGGLFDAMAEGDSDD